MTDTAGPRSIHLFIGCQNRGEAESRFRTFLEGCYLDAERKLVTDLLTSDPKRLDDVNESIDSALEMSREFRAHGIEDAMVQFRRMCDEWGLPP